MVIPPLNRDNTSALSATMYTSLIRIPLLGQKVLHFLKVTLTTSSAGPLSPSDDDAQLDEDGFFLAATLTSSSSRVRSMGSEEEDPTDVLLTSDFTSGLTGLGGYTIISWGGFAVEQKQVKLTARAVKICAEMLMLEGSFQTPAVFECYTPGLPTYYPGCWWRGEKWKNNSCSIQTSIM